MRARFLNALTASWGLKLAALALALLLWMAVRASEPKTATFRNIPVEVDLRDPQWRLAEGPDPPGVSVTVLGPTGDLLALASQPPRIVLPVELVTDTVETQVLPIQWVQMPRGVTQSRIVSLRPDTIHLRYEPVETRTLPVRVRTRGELEEGLALALPVGANPGAVQVRGPARLVRQLDSVPLLPVDVSGFAATTNVLTPVDTAGLAPLRFTPSEVSVVFRIVPAEPVNDTIAPPPDDGA